MIESWLFYLAAAGSVVGALAVVLARSPLRAAMCLIVTLCCIAVLYLLMDAAFVATMQVLVYAGAIMVLFVFVIMLLNLGPEISQRPVYLSVAKSLGFAGAAYLVWRLVTEVGGTTGRAVDGSVKSIGRLLLTDYLFAFEAVSVLILVAVVGAVVLGQKRLT